MKDPEIYLEILPKPLSVERSYKVNITDVIPVDVKPRDVEFLNMQIETTSNPHAQLEQKRIHRKVIK